MQTLVQGLHKPVQGMQTLVQGLNTPVQGLKLANQEL